MANIIEKVTELADEAASMEQCELVEVEYLKEGGEWILRVSVDNLAGGVKLENCAAISDRLEGLLDVHDVIPQAYRLEVSSPGLTRPLKKKAHFVRFAGRCVALRTYQPLAAGPLGESRKHFKGELLGIDGDDILLLVDGETIKFSLNLISKANLELDF